MTGSNVANVVCGAAAMLLVVAGVAKLSNRTPTRLAVRELGWAVSSKWVVILGGAEVVGGALLFVTRWWLAALGATGLYVAFAVVVWRLMYRSTPCGCFGRSEIPPGWGHVAMNVVCAVGCAGVSVDPPGRPSASQLAVEALAGGAVALSATVGATRVSRRLRRPSVR